MSKRFHWLAIWDATRMRWHPLGCRRLFEHTADLIPPSALGPGRVCHLGTVFCGKSLTDAERALAALPPPPGVVRPTVH